MVIGSKSGIPDGPRRAADMWACPDATVIKPDMKKYAAVGRTMRLLF